MSMKTLIYFCGLDLKHNFGELSEGVTHLALRFERKTIATYFDRLLGCWVLLFFVWCFFTLEMYCFTIEFIINYTKINPAPRLTVLHVNKNTIKIIIQT